VSLKTFGNFFILFLDLLAVPKHPYAAMENWGLSIFVEQRILLDPSVSSISYLLDVTMVIVHEICHQVRERNRCKYNVKLSGMWGDFRHPDEELGSYPPIYVLYKALCIFCAHGISFFSGDKVSTHIQTDGIE
jgi:hypothetical protein